MQTPQRTEYTERQHGVGKKWSEWQKINKGKISVMLVPKEEEKRKIGREKRGERGERKREVRR